VLYRNRNRLRIGNRSEAKLVRCTKGAIFEVVLDLRQGIRPEGNICTS
jgi:hypothetical protein